MGRRYGSKAAYEEARKDARTSRAEMERIWNMTDEERAEERRMAAKGRIAEALEGEGGAMAWALFMAGAMARTVDIQQAGQCADLALAQFRERFG